MYKKIIKPCTKSATHLITLSFLQAIMLNMFNCLFV